MERGSKLLSFSGHGTVSFLLGCMVLLTEERQAGDDYAKCGEHNPRG